MTDLDTGSKDRRHAVVAAMDNLNWGFENGEYNAADAFLTQLDKLGYDLIERSPHQLPEAGVLVRTADETGVSGTGPVAWVVEFPDGVVVTRWAVTDIRQTCVWESLSHVLAIHGHDGRTTPEWSGSGDLGADWTEQRGGQS